MRLGEKDNEFVIPIKNTGNGFVALFVIAMFQSLLKEEGNLFLINEPETYLHDNYQKHFYKLLCQLAEKNQVILATHSKNFVYIFEPRSIIKVENIGFSKSTIVQTEEVLDKEEIEVNLGKKLEFPQEYGLFVNSIEPNLNSIPFSSKVIICEGCHDKVGYSNVLDKYLQDENTSLALENISIVAAVGKATIGHLAKICKFFNIPVFAIHDADLDEDCLFNNDLDEDSHKHLEYKNLGSNDRGQYTNNWNIYKTRPLS